MQSLTKQELKRMNEVEEADFVLINVLPLKHFKEKHIRTSINLPYDDENFASSVEKVAGGKDRDVVVYCASFDCDASTKAARKLEDADFTSVFDYEGGTKDWFEQKQKEVA